EEYKMRDPVETTRQKILDYKYAAEKEVELIEQNIESEIEACVKFAEESPYPDDAAVYEDIYTQNNYPFIKD
ncbi:MAG: pyruvate dehydrogenase (acetyl-transferring) E1 component subunit alpha, partial [Chitinophagales bacterium]